MRPYCDECCFFGKHNITGNWICGLNGKNTCPNKRCDLGALDGKQIIKGLHVLQKWRRGSKRVMPNPYVIGRVIDEAIRQLREVEKERE